MIELNILKQTSIVFSNNDKRLVAVCSASSRVSWRPGRWWLWNCGLRMRSSAGRRWWARLTRTKLATSRRPRCAHASAPVTQVRILLDGSDQTLSETRVPDQSPSGPRGSPTSPRTLSGPVRSGPCSGCVFSEQHLLTAMRRLTCNTN